jgi:hypothetical protein
MYTDKTAPTDQSQQSNLTIQIHVIPPNQIYWVHLSFYNDGLILIPSSTPASTGTISGTISTNAKIDRYSRRPIRYSRRPLPTLAAARVRQHTSSRDAAMVTIPSRGYPTRSRGVAPAISARHSRHSSPRARLPHRQTTSPP